VCIVLNQSSIDGNSCKVVCYDSENDNHPVNEGGDEGQVVVEMGGERA
jgi:hypothetical protein